MPPDESPIRKDQRRLTLRENVARSLRNGRCQSQLVAMDINSKGHTGIAVTHQRLDTLGIDTGHAPELRSKRMSQRMQIEDSSGGIAFQNHRLLFSVDHHAFLSRQAISQHFVIKAAKEAIGYPQNRHSACP